MGLSVISSLLLGLAGLRTAMATAPDFSGSGYIYVLNSTNLINATYSDSIGCLDATGALSVDDCGLFTKLDDYPYTISTSEGNCSFTDTTQPTNDDSAYGSSSYAFHCRADYVALITDQFYTTDGISYPFLCEGNVNCYYDIKTGATTNSTSSVWEFIWGTQQTTISEGHSEVIWVWNSTSS